jgi:hypothetical protein
MKSKTRKAAGKASLDPLVRRSGWAVYSAKGRVCINDECMPAIFTHRPRAVEFRDALVPHIGKCKVIRVEITVSSNEQVRRDSAAPGGTDGH